ncbi:DUF4381 family protein [Leclercia adecarboxylata]|uniref:DUF4381 family protein n=1 Tax=Leclercia adecarboxylata TaxID=83655 RepID=UPI00119D656E|nr:DUF4381 family protein [Leclercia adecarboxylata]
MLEKGFTVPDLLQPPLPDAISWFPLPVGWSVLGAVLGLFLLLALLFRAARWRRNRWRRQAQAAIDATETVDRSLALIKQIQLVHQPRKQVSMQVSPAMLLQSVPLDADLRQALCDKYCQPDNQLKPGELQRLRLQLSRWLGELPDV